MLGVGVQLSGKALFVEFEFHAKVNQGTVKNFNSQSDMVRFALWEIYSVY